MFDKPYLWHPIFVHFSIALLAFAAVLYLLAGLRRRAALRRQWIVAAEWNLWIGLGLTVFTAMFGWLAYNTVAHDDVAHPLMESHAAAALAMFGAFALLAAWSRRQRRSEGYPSLAFMALAVVGLVLLGVTGWRGGDLVYDHGLAVAALPKPEGPAAASPNVELRSDHAHAHGTRDPHH